MPTSLVIVVKCEGRIGFVRRIRLRVEARSREWAETRLMFLRGSSETEVSAGRMCLSFRGVKMEGEGG